ncbi:MAG: hypothetical protein J6C98_01990 [Oscillospiraceae bacterium]|nr:hypothetical protein [Oscillospiraceae bacterium]
MNLKIKALLTACLLLMTLTFVTGCAEELNPYEVNDAESYNVSVKYDANGGIFTTNTSVIVDSYNVSNMNTNSEGKAEIALLSPDDTRRGNDAFAAVNNGYFLAGWYTERTEQADGTYTYSGLWDFESDRLAVDAGETHTSAEPVVTLYAAWVPLFEIEFYALDSGEYLDTFTFNPITSGDLELPAWDEETGAIDMNDFPERSGYTYNGAYYDAEGAEPVDTATLTHTGEIDYATGTARDETMKLYVEWTEGEWYHIYNVEQFLDNASVNGNYVIHADLDFAGEIWPTSLMYGNFGGTIEGNGHTFSNIEVIQTNNSKVNAGLFGNLTETANISGLTLDNVTFTIQAGTRVVGTSFGLLAGTISESTVFTDVQILNSTLQIDSGCYFGTDDYVIGLLCGMGNSAALDYSGITCVAVGDNAASVQITVNGNDVSVEFITA